MITRVKRNSLLEYYGGTYASFEVIDELKNTYVVIGHKNHYIAFKSNYLDSYYNKKCCLLELTYLSEEFYSGYFNTNLTEFIFGNSINPPIFKKFIKPGSYYYSWF